MNDVLSKILDTGYTLDAAGTGTVTAVSIDEGRWIQHLVRHLDPTATLEVGLAYGISALFICDALNIREQTQHIVIDPNQNGGPWGHSWEGMGIANLRRAGFGKIIRLIEEPSYRALAALEKSGQRLDFAFIDGWHTFDFTLLDFFFIDKMLNVGGVIAFDDANWPAVRKVCRFVKTNLSYSIAGTVGATNKSPSLKRRLAKQVFRYEPFRSLVKPQFLLSDADLNASSITFRKDANDSRRWDHFVDF